MPVMAGSGEPKRAIVLGSGGVLGFAWMLGGLSALEAVTGFDARTVDFVLGTSAGSVGAALLGCGLPVQTIARHHQGVPSDADPVIAYDYDTATGAPRPPRPRLRPGSPQLLLGGVRHPLRTPLLVALCGLLPTGRGTLAPVGDMVERVAQDAGYGQSWPERPRPWIVALNYRTGERTVFGRTASESTRLADAVTASCSIPGWYPPAVIDGQPYVDGGAASIASIDLLGELKLDEVYVFAAMASVQPDRPRSAVSRAERWMRGLITRRIQSDLAALRGAGTRTYLVTPGPADLAMMGVNLMNTGRRLDVFDLARRTAEAQLRSQLGLRECA